MTGCTQRGCTGTIVDGYCDVCGSPVGAPPFIPAVAAASASSPALAGRTGLTASGGDRDFPRDRETVRSEGVSARSSTVTAMSAAAQLARRRLFGAAAASTAAPAPAARTGLKAGGRGSGFPARPRNCTQRGCIGTIVDGYCDVCGSPAGAPPFIPAVPAAQQPNGPEEESPTQRIPRVQVPAELPSAQEMAGPAAADPEEESPTQRIPRVQVPAELPSAQEMADPAAADPEEESPTQRIPRVQVPAELPSAQEMAGPAAADPEEESPTQRIPRVQMPAELPSAEEMADQAAADQEESAIQIRRPEV